MEIITLPDKTSIDFDRLKKSTMTFQKYQRAKKIFHYTSIGGLEGILSNYKLWFTNIKYLNDKDEIIAGLDSISKAFNISDNDRETIRDVYINYDRQTFVCCFSLDGDSLPLWNYYTKEVNNQGYNIEFDDKKLVESILRNNDILNGCNLSFGTVDYSKNDDSKYSDNIAKDALSTLELSILRAFLTIAKAQEFFDHQIIDLSTIAQIEAIVNNKEKELQNLPINYFNGENCSFDATPHNDCLSYIKRDYFKQEREFRIAITVPNSLLPYLAEKKAYKFRVSNGLLIPYIEVCFSEDVVNSITISPTVQYDLIEVSLKSFLEYRNYSTSKNSAFIKRSKIPVRF